MSARLRATAITIVIALVAVLVTFMGSAEAAGPWHDADRPHRFGLDFDPGATSRFDRVAVADVDFTASLGQAGLVGVALDTTSIRVVEVDGTGALVAGGASVPFQFDGEPGFDPASNAAGELSVLLTGSITSVRRYQVYFRDLGTAGAFSPEDHSGLGRVSIATNKADEGRAVSRVMNDDGTWFFDNEGGGFTSIVDTGSRDWINWNTDPGSAGAFRGLPNLEFPTNEFHPGFDHVSTSVDASGPLRVLLTSTSDDGEWVMRWSFFKQGAMAEVIRTPADAEYWFQYEGTPGGTLGEEDSIIRNDGSVDAHDGAWVVDLEDLEWVAAADSDANRSFYVAQITPDEATDVYKVIDGVMSVLSFGRSLTGLDQGLTGQREFAVGLVTGSTHSVISPVIEKATAPIVATVGAGQTTSTPTTSTAPTTTSASPPTTEASTNSGYRIVTSSGRVLSYEATSLGDAPPGGDRVVAAASTPSGDGYWLVRSSGEVLAFGDALHHGDVVGLGLQLAAPIVGMAATPSGDGYWLLGADGGIFSFGGALFYGSTGDFELAAPVIDMAPTPSGHGYFLVALDGGIFTFGDALFLGSTGNLVLDRPVVSMTLGNVGYWLVALDGGIFAFSEPFIGSIPGVLSHLTAEQRPVGKRIRATPSGTGYLVVTADGGLFRFGNALFMGSAAGALAPGETAVDLLMLT